MPKVTFLPAGVTVEFDPATMPYGDHGRPGSLLDFAMNGGVDIQHDCGGFASCTTCHVHVSPGFEKSLSPMEDDEYNALDIARYANERSRLCCQALVQGDVEVTVAGA